MLIIAISKWLKIPNLDYIGIAVLGLAGVLFGLEAIVRRRMVINSGSYRYGTETYLGIAGIAQGVQFVFLGIFLSTAGLLAYFNSGREVFNGFIRHPGPILLVLGVYCLTAAVIAFVGSVEQKQGTRFAVVLDLLASRLLPGFILVVLSFVALGLGFLEILAPQVFDQLGGGFLEVLFGVK